MGDTLLSVDNLSAFYGEAQVLRDVSIDVAAGEVVTLVGRNGAGKTTLLRSIMGLHRAARGSITFDGSSLDGRSADKRARLGLGWVPDDDGRGGYHGQMAVLVKRNGLLGRLYMAAIEPFRHVVVYPAMMRRFADKVHFLHLRNVRREGEGVDDGVGDALPADAPVRARAPGSDAEHPVEQQHPLRGPGGEVAVAGDHPDVVAQLAR